MLGLIWALGHVRERQGGADSSGPDGVLQDLPAKEPHQVHKVGCLHQDDSLSSSRTEADRRLWYLVLTCSTIGPPQIAVSHQSRFLIVLYAQAYLAMMDTG